MKSRHRSQKVRRGRAAMKAQPKSRQLSFEASDHRRGISSRPTAEGLAAGVGEAVGVCRAGHDPPILRAKLAGYADANPPYGDAEHRFADVAKA